MIEKSIYKGWSLPLLPVVNQNGERGMAIHFIDQIQGPEEASV